MDEQVTRLRQAYRDAASAEPGPDLDARILAAARQAVQSKPAARRARTWAWLLPASSMAVLLLAVGVVLRVQHEAPESLGVEADARRAPASAPRSGMPPEARAPAAEDVAASPTPAETKRAAPIPRDEPALPAARPPGAARPSPEAPADVAERTTGAPARATGVATYMPTEPAGEVAARASIKEFARESERESARESSLAAKSASSAVPERREKTQAARATGDAAVMAPVPAAPPAPQAFPLREGNAAGAGALNDAAPVPAAKRAPRMSSQAAHGNPEAAIEAIRAQLRAGRAEEARRLLRDFEAAYPGHALPEDLLALRRDLSGAPGQ